MMYHVGIYHYKVKNVIYVSTYDTLTKITNVFQKYKVNQNEEIDFIVIFEEIRLAFEDDDLGCCCIYLEDNYDNEYRKECIKNGKIYGFQKVEFLNVYGNQYLQAVFNANYQHRKNETIWLTESDGTYVWEKIHGKAQLVLWFPWNIFTDKYMKKLKIVSQLHKSPKAIICPPKSDIDDCSIKNILPKTKICVCKHYLNHNTPLIKSRLMAADTCVTNFDFVYILHDRIVVLYDDIPVILFQEFEALPCQKFCEILKTEGKDFLKICKRENTVEHRIPYTRRFLITVEVDINEIYNIVWKELPLCSISNKTQVLMNEFLNKAINDMKFIPAQKHVCHIPNVAINDTSISAVGIDFGTSSCRAAVNRRHGLEAITLDYWQRNLASYVSFDERNTKCGQIVAIRLKNFARSSVFDIKQFIGRQHNEFIIDPLWEFHILPLENSKFCIEVNSSEGILTKYPEEVVSILFSTIKSKSQEYKNRELSAVAIAFPLYFNENQRNGIFVAAMLAEWKAVHLLPEPIAAAFAYFIDKKIQNNSTVLVFDLGGEGLNICNFKVINEEIVILGHHYNSTVGGKAFETILFDHFEDKLQTDFGIHIDENKKLKLNAECQKIKEYLSTEDICCLDVGEFDFTSDEMVSITREEFEMLANPLLYKIKNIANFFVEKANVNKIDKILYVGGGCRMPMIKNLLKEMFQKSEHCCHEHPDEVIAIGAAYYAYYLNSSTRQICLLYLENVLFYKNMQVELKNENENEHFNDQLFFEVNKYDIHGTGIDFGETFCRAAINRRNGLEVISLDNAGQKFLPSCVAFDEKIAKCGQIVLNRMRQHAKSSVYDIKAFIGRKYEDIVIHSSWPFQIVPLENKNHCIKVQNVEGFVGMFSEDALAVIFKCIKQKTEEYKAEKLEEVVISVPYNFNESQRNAVSIAAKIAEWKTVWLLQEPFAAVYGYWYLLPKTQTPGTILVIDFGGGNLNVCILRVTNKEIALLSYQNNNKVGGKMFDEILIEYFENKLKTDFQILIPGNKRFLLKKESQKIKEELSIVEKQWLNIDVFDPNHDNEILINRTEFEFLSSSLLNDIKTTIATTIFESNSNKIDKILYVGGGCRMPMIKNLLKEMFQESEHCCYQHPDEVIAIGAAYYAHYLIFHTLIKNNPPVKSEPLDINNEPFDIINYLLKHPQLFGSE